MRLAVFLFFPSVVLAQQSVSTSASCSPIAPHNLGSITINCPGMSKERGDKMLAILNKIQINQLDPDLVMKKLDEIQAGVEDIRKQEQFSSMLTPGNEPTPENSCTGRTLPDSVLLLAGNAANYITKMPNTIIQIREDKMLWIDRIDGKIAVSAKLFSSDRKIVAELDKNQFFINPNNYFRKEISPDGHSLIVYDQEDVQVLNVKFLNPNTVAFLGVIRHPIGILQISKTEGFFSKFSPCISGSPVDFLFNDLPAVLE